VGLEGVELVLEVEEAFGVPISDPEAQQTKTVGQLHDLILSKLPTSEGCGAMIAFHRLRRGFQAQGVPRAEVTRDSRLALLLRLARRRKGWRDLSLVAGLKLPELRIPLLVVVAAVGVTALAAAVALRVGAAIFTVWVVAAVVLALVTLLRLFRLLLPAGCDTVGDLATRLAAQNPSLSASTRPTPAEVWSRLVEMISRIGGVAPERITHDAQLFEYLRFGV
jgi:hypothetical protein